jgi:hypothetical protein
VRHISKRSGHFKVNHGRYLGRGRQIKQFGRDASLLSTNLITAGENLAEHPHRIPIEGAIGFWRAGAARNSDKVCFGCRTVFNIGRAVPGAFLVSIAIGANSSSAAIGGLCTACFAKTDAEIDQAAARMLRRITGPRGHWLNPLPSQVQR